MGNSNYKTIGFFVSKLLYFGGGEAPKILKKIIEVFKEKIAVFCTFGGKLGQIWSIYWIWTNLGVKK